MVLGRSPRSLALAGLLVASTLLVGCIGSGEDIQQQSVPDLDDVLGTVLQLRPDHGFVLDTPVPVVLIGFEPGTAAALDERLEDEEVLHAALSYTRNFPPGSGQPVDGDDLVTPATSRAVYDVVEMDEAFAQATFAAATPVDGEDGLYDANAMEDHLASALPTAGVELDEDLPAIVLLHAGDRLDGEHAWRFSYLNGELSPVRTFGERTPMVVYDTSATPDPYVVDRSAGTFGPVFGSGGDVEAYNYPMEAGGEETTELLHDLVLDITHYRILKGAIYPISTKPCHHVTFVLAVHQSAVSHLAPGARGPEAWVDVPAQTGAFENATGDEVTVDLKTLMLPVDDPVLDATTRRAAGMAESGVFLDTMRWYLDENWEAFVDPQAGCEEYLSLLLFADYTSELGRSFGGIGMYDVNTDRRITFSVVTDHYRLQNEYDGPGDEMVGYDEDRTPDYVNRLFSHETGHILGLHHPQHLIRADGEGSPVNHAFESVWSSMSYQVSDRTIDFGVIDRAQFQRNRAGYTLQQAQLLDLEGTPAFQQALTQLAGYDWQGAQAALEGPVHEAMDHGDHEHAERLGYQSGGHHWHGR